MFGLFWIVFWAGLAALVVAAAVSLRTRKRERLGSSVPFVDDDAVEQILAVGRLQGTDLDPGDLPIVMEDDEPLDQGEIDDEEERFWSESWDEPSEW